MLPKFTHSIVAGVTAVALTAATVAPAQAFDRDERQFLKGVAATLLVQGIIKHAKKNNQPQVVTPVQPQYYQPAYATSSIYSTPAAAAFKSYTPTQRRLIQQRLAAYGYYHSSIDGAFGPGTYNAITRYAGDIGQSTSLQTTGAAYAVYDRLIYG